MKILNIDSEISRAQYNRLVDEKILNISNIKVNIFSFLTAIRKLIDHFCDIFKIISELAYSNRVIFTINEQCTEVLKAQQIMINALTERVNKLEGK